MEKCRCPKMKEGRHMGNNLEFKELTREFRMGSMIFGSRITAVDHVSLKIESDKPWIMSIVGESGSGKTTLARMLLRLLEPSSGEIFVDDTPLSAYSKNKKQFYRKVQPIFQNPFTSFSTRRTVESYLFETAVNLEVAKNRAEAEDVIVNVLHSVGLDYEQVKGKYTTQFSGGELQRISVARALIPKPALILADEPVAMIDASMRMNIVNLFKSLKTDYNVSFIYITHDLSTAYYVSNYIATLYRGNLVEFGNAQEVLNNPAHPYTELLLESIPRVGKLWDDAKVLPDIESREYRLGACKLVSRCPYAKEICRGKKPGMVNLSSEHRVLCYKYNNYNAT
jgi:peptide/nickel transport system ATP-binding protein